MIFPASRSRSFCVSQTTCSDLAAVAPARAAPALRRGRPRGLRRQGCGRRLLQRRPVRPGRVLDGDGRADARRHDVRHQHPRAQRPALQRRPPPPLRPRGRSRRPLTNPLSGGTLSTFPDSLPIRADLSVPIQNEPGKVLITPPLDAARVALTARCGRPRAHDEKTRLLTSGPVQEERRPGTTDTGRRPELGGAALDLTASHPSPLNRRAPDQPVARSPCQTPHLAHPHGNDKELR